MEQLPFLHTDNVKTNAAQTAKFGRSHFVGSGYARLRLPIATDMAIVIRSDTRSYIAAIIII